MSTSKQSEEDQELRHKGPPTRILLVGPTTTALATMQKLLVAGIQKSTGIRVLSLRQLRMDGSRLLALDGQEEVEIGHRRASRATLYSCLEKHSKEIRRMFRRQRIPITSVLTIGEVEPWVTAHPPLDSVAQSGHTRLT